jgi:hypothetical protein
MPSKVAIDPEEPSLGRIRADSIAPPHTLSSILRHISRVETTPALASSHLFADISSDSPLTEGYISTLHSEGLGLTPDTPVAIVQVQDSPQLPRPPNILSSFYDAANYEPEFFPCMKVKDHSPNLKVF